MVRRLWLTAWSLGVTTQTQSEAFSHHRGNPFPGPSILLLITKKILKFILGDSHLFDLVSLLSSFHM